MKLIAIIILFRIWHYDYIDQIWLYDFSVSAIYIIILYSYYK